MRQPHNASVLSIHYLKTLYLQQLESETFLSLWQRNFANNPVKEAKRILTEMEKDWHHWSTGEIVDKSFLEDPSSLFDEMTGYLFVVSSADKTTTEWKRLTDFFRLNLPLCF